MPEKLRIKCSVSLETLTGIIGQVLAVAVDCGLNKTRLGELELALEEILVNILNHANTKNDNNVEIAASVDDDNSFVLQVIDDGMPFDPLAEPDPDLNVDIVDRPIGGLGIFLVKQLMDDVRYRRENEQNILELIIKREE
jgi:serine/threonine-protein kinase RsbW